jgi:hypothetical protein
MESQIRKYKHTKYRNLPNILLFVQVLYHFDRVFSHWSQAKISTTTISLLALSPALCPICPLTLASLLSSHSHCMDKLISELNPAQCV